MTAVEIQGVCDPRFERVREAFAANFSERGEAGASLCLIVDGETVLDLWGGRADAEGARAWQRDTIANVYSSTKGVAALAAAMLADRGLLDVEAPVAEYWPEFARAGKEAITVRQLLTHEAGLAGIDEELPDLGVLDWDHMIGAIERQAPLWTPGEGLGYHAVTYGWLVGEVIRRITGKTCGEFVSDEIAVPLGVDFFIGLPASEDARTADMIPPESGNPIELPDPDSLAAKALGFVNPRVAGTVNSREWRAAELPAANGHGNARALARIYAAMARGGELDGVRLLSPEGVAAASAHAVTADDLVLGFPVKRALGFLISLPGGRYEWGPNPNTYGHSGAGGSIGFADPDAGIGFGYVMNQMSAGLGADPRWAPMINAVYASL